MQEQISKKDLLRETGISYGQLYRWKRMGLIPEEWFVRRSTFTGTETFFPRARILARIEKIKSMKDGDLSLEEIAEAVAPTLGDVSLSPSEVMDRGIAGRAAVDLYMPQRRHEGAFVLGEVLTLHVLDGLLTAGAITAEEGRAFVETLESGISGRASREFEALLVRKAGLSLWILAARGCRPVLEESARIVVEVDLAARLEGLRAILMEEEGTPR